MPPALTQVDTLHPWLDNEFPLDATGMPHPAPRALNLPAPATTTAYTELQDGTWGVSTYPPYWAGGIKAMGGTPVAYSIRDVDTAFTNIWNNGQTAGTPAPPYALDAIRNHKNPKEKTILLFVTDGADTCAGSGDGAALIAADYAKNLYQPVTGGCKDTDDPGDSLTSTPICDDVDRDGVDGFAEPASSVQTFMIGYGDAVNTPADVNRLNWMAWGGSGLYKDFVGSNSGSQRHHRRQPARRPREVQDLPGRLHRDQRGDPRRGAPGHHQPGRPGRRLQRGAVHHRERLRVRGQGEHDAGEFDSTDPKTRYRAITPTRFISSFTLPGFRGQLKAYQNDGLDDPATPLVDESSAVLRWSAADKLNALVRARFNDTYCPQTNGSAFQECMFSQLHGGFNVANAVIQRRIYTTSRNGTFLNFSNPAADLIAGTANGRVNLWPPDPALVPTGTAQGTLPGSGIVLDRIFGLPLDSTTQAATDYTDLQSQYLACTGTNLPAGCTSTTALTRMQAARKEAREMILAFMAGAEPVPTTGGLKRTGTGGTAAGRNQILYRYRSWVLSDAELATAAVVTPPLPSEPKATPYVEEYKQFRDGPYVLDGTTAPDSDTMIRRGFGLRNPDADGVDRDPQQPEAGHDRHVRPRQRHAARLPGRAEHEPQLDVRHLREHAPPHVRLRRRGAVGIRPLRPAERAGAALPEPAPDPRQPRLHARAGHPLLRHLRPPGSHRRRRRGQDDPLAPGSVASDPVHRPRHRRQVHDGARRDGARALHRHAPQHGGPDPRLEPGQPGLAGRPRHEPDEQQHGLGPDRLRQDGPDLVHPGGRLHGPGEPHLPLDAGEPRADRPRPVHGIRLRRHALRGDHASTRSTPSPGTSSLPPTSRRSPRPSGSPGRCPTPTRSSPTRRASTRRPSASCRRSTRPPRS